jgi:hypothetical protein
MLAGNYILFSLGHVDQRLPFSDMFFEDAPRFGGHDAMVEESAPAGGRHQAYQVLIFAGNDFAHEHIDATLTLAEAAEAVEYRLVAGQRARAQLARQRCVDIVSVQLVTAFRAATH